jgi:hypothetical protein
MPRYRFPHSHTLILSKRDNLPFQLMTRRHRSYKGHSWTEEELNLVCYLRSIRHWRFTQIQRAKFPLLSRHAVGGAYRKLPPAERTRRALAVASVLAKSRHTAGRKSPHQAQAASSSLEQIPRSDMHHWPRVIATQPGTVSGQTDPQRSRSESHDIRLIVSVSLTSSNRTAVISRGATYQIVNTSLHHIHLRQARRTAAHLSSRVSPALRQV